MTTSAANIMTVNVINTLTIFASAMRQTSTELENALNTANALLAVQDFALSKVETVIGSWKEEGQETASREVSLCFDVKCTDLQKVLDLFCTKYEQDAILAVTKGNEAIVYDNESNFPVGIMQEITEQEALTSECYTLWNGKYFLAK